MFVWKGEGGGEGGLEGEEIEFKNIKRHIPLCIYTYISVCLCVKINSERLA